MSQHYHRATELAERLPGFSLLYALGYFGNVTPVTRQELAARFTCPADNVNSRRGAIGVIFSREAKLIDQLMFRGEDGKQWRAARRGLAARFGSLTNRMPYGLAAPDMVELRRLIDTEPNPWTGVSHLNTDFDPAIHTIQTPAPSVTEGSLVDAIGDDNAEWDTSEENPIFVADVGETMQFFNVDVDVAVRVVTEAREYQRIYEISFPEVFHMFVEELRAGVRSRI